MIRNTRFIASVTFCIAVLPTVAAAQGGGRVDIAGGYARSGHARPFAQILFGTTRFTSTYQLPKTTLSASDNLFTTEIAGGVDVPVVPHVALRLAVQRRYVRASPDTLTGAPSNTFHQTQLLGGLAFR